MAWYPRVCDKGAKGCSRANSGQEMGSISAVPLSFIVQEPSGIMELSTTNPGFPAAANNAAFPFRNDAC
jgi:hypothetical protein